MASDELNDAAQTAIEHVAAAAADPSSGRGAQARPSRKAELQPEAKPGYCANCGTQLRGPVCHNCGQLADEFHRPVRGLLSELIEGFLALDGRVAKTIPALLFQPGRMTRSYLKGQRARYMPPFRLYIIASLVFFLLVPVVTSTFQTDPDVMREAVESGGDQVSGVIEQSVETGDLTDEEAEQVRDAFALLGLENLLDPDNAAPATPETEAQPDTQASEPESVAETGLIDVNASPLRIGFERGDGEEAVFELNGESDTPDDIRRFFTPEDFGEPAPEGAWPYSVRSYLGERFARVAEDPDEWLASAARWVPRIMFVMVPIYALLLALTYLWRRGFFLFDHLIVSVHFHAALFLSMAFFYKLGGLIGGLWAGVALLVYANWYLYRLHRVVYARSRFTSLLRTVTLDFLYAIVLAFGLLAVLLLGALAS